MKDITTYEEAKEYLLSIPKFTKKNSLEDTRRFYEFLGKPGGRSKVLHVAGTNGKGSVCAYMDSCLRSGGYSTGMFTSPHLVTVRERIRLNGEWISRQDFLDTFLELTEYLEGYCSKKLLDKEAYHPTFFEWLFFMTMLFFEEKKPQVILLETGLGGRLDATNVIDPPTVCIITPVGMDHREYLGTTYEEIAREKAGIIKRRSRVVYAAMRPESERVIEERGKECACSCRRVSKERETGFDLSHKRIDFSFFSRYYGYIPLRLSTMALYQVENARLALTALEEAGFTLNPEQMEGGVRLCRWEGRMEEILPNVFLDGAHNREGIKAFLETVKHDGCQGKRWLLFSVVGDKEVQVVADCIKESGLFERICIVPLENKRGLEAECIKALFKGLPVMEESDTPRAFKRILKQRGEEDMVYIAGSLYLVGEVKEFLSQIDGGKAPAM